MNTLSTTATLLAYSFSYALLYSLLQGLLVFGLLFIVLKAVPGMSARIKYTVSVIAFSAIALWFADTWVSQYNKLSGVTVYVSDSAPGDYTYKSGGIQAVHTSTQAGMDMFRTYLPELEEYVPVILLLYCAGLLFMLLKFMVNLRQLRQLSKTGVSAPGRLWVEFVGRWQHQFGIARRVQVLLSSKVDVPMMLGTMKPVILLPVAAINNLSIEQLEAILLHELAHIKRHDFLMNLFQTVVETVLFFNPFVWLISAVIRREREHCCDDLVVSSASNPLHYASALALLEDNRVHTNSLSLAATGNKNQLFNRIKRIMEMKKEHLSQNRLSVVTVAIIATTFLISMIVFTPTFAQKAKDEKKEPVKKTVTKTVTVDNTGKKKVVTKTKNGSAEATDDEDVDIHISVKEDDKKHGKAKIVISANCNDDAGSGKEKKVRKEVIISADDMGDNGPDMEKMHEEIAKAQRELDKVDWKEIEAEITAAIAEVKEELNLEQLGKDISIEIKKGLEQSKAELARARAEIDRSKHVAIHISDDKDARAAEEARVHAEANRSKHMAKQIEDEEEARAMARSGNKVTYSSSIDMEEMLDKMDREGLINRNNKFRIEKEDGKLYINGERQSTKVYNKYSQYLSANHVTVKGGKGNLNINMTN
jgi:bla regulator protein blaR1